jgi:hypothetical protein
MTVGRSFFLFDERSFGLCRVGFVCNSDIFIILFSRYLLCSVGGGVADVVIVWLEPGILDMGKSDHFIRRLYKDRERRWLI